MRPRRLTSILLAVVACATIATITNDAFAQTLDRTLVRRFPSGSCPLPTIVIGTFTTTTTHIELSFVTPNGYDNGVQFVHHQQVLDNVAIIEESWFNAHATDNTNFCYNDPDWGTAKDMAPADLAGRPEVPYYDTFDPSPGPCDWDVSNGATIAGGALQLGSNDLGLVEVSTSVVISGLTPGVSYVIYADWTAEEFNVLLDCTDPAICMRITVDELQNGCGTLPVTTTTWGAVKALYQN